MEQTMIKAGRYDLNEASLGRVYQLVVSNPKMKNRGVVTASRGELSKAENKKRNKELEADLRKMGYGFVAKGEATFIDSKSGESFNIGKFSPGKIAQGYSKMKGGRVFTFEPKKAEEPKKVNTPKVTNSKLTANLPKDIANKMVRNPKTGRDIKVTSALKYDTKSPVHKAATSLVAMLNKKK